jgi:hypothetical protein
MASASTSNEDDRDVVLRHSIEVPSLDRQNVSRPSNISMPAVLTTELRVDNTEDKCDKNHDLLGATITIMSTSKQAGKTVAPFLAKHIPEQYAPMGPGSDSQTQRDPSTKYCYRHRPDSKCRRTADEPTMENLQRVCSSGLSIDTSY